MNLGAGGVRGSGEARAAWTPSSKQVAGDVDGEWERPRGRGSGRADSVDPGAGGVHGERRGAGGVDLQPAGRRRCGPGVGKRVARTGEWESGCCGSGSGRHGQESCEAWLGVRKARAMWTERGRERVV